MPNRRLEKSPAAKADAGNPSRRRMDSWIEKNVVQGQMVDAGMKLYRLANLGIVWVFAQVYEQDLPYVQLGEEATVKLSSLPDREFRGRVTYVYPNVDEKTRTAKVRLEFPNPGYFLKPGMFVSAQITGGIGTFRVVGVRLGHSAQRREEHRVRRAVRRQI